MNRRLARSKSTLFLIELVLAIGIFAVSSAICIQLFVKAYLLSRNSEELTHSLYEATSAAEVFKNSGGDIDEMSRLLSTHLEDGELVVYYNKDWNVRAQMSPGGYTMRIKLNSDKSPAEANIVLSDSSGEVIYSLTAKKQILEVNL